MPAPVFVHVYFCMHMYEDACAAFSSLLLSFFFFCLEDQHKQGKTTNAPHAESCSPGGNAFAHTAHH